MNDLNSYKTQIGTAGTGHEKKAWQQNECDLEQQIQAKDLWLMELGGRGISNYTSNRMGFILGLRKMS